MKGFIRLQFLVANMQLYERLCPSVAPSVHHARVENVKNAYLWYCICYCVCVGDWVCVCVCYRDGWGWGWGEAWDWMPLPTRSQQYHNPATLFKRTKFMKILGLKSSKLKNIAKNIETLLSTLEFFSLHLIKYSQKKKI